METLRRSLCHGQGGIGSLLFLAFLTFGLAGCPATDRRWTNPYDPKASERLTYETFQTGVDAQLRSDIPGAPHLNPANSQTLISAPGDAIFYLTSVELDLSFISSLGNVNVERMDLGIMVLSFTGAPSASLTVFCPAAWLPLNTQTYANMAPVSGTAAPLTWKLNAYQDITFGGTVANKFNGVPRFILQANGPGNVTGGFMTLSNTYRIRVYYKPRI